VRRLVLHLLFIVSTGAWLSAFAPLRVQAGAPAVPVKTCKLEEGVGRVRFTVDRPDDAESVHLRLRFFDKQKKWLADELIEAWGFDAPILPIAGLFDSSDVASVECTIDGYDKKTELVGVQPLVAIASPNAPGRKPCPDPRGLIVDGGDDADFEAAVVGRNWIMFRMRATIARFLSDRPTLFAGDAFSAKLDRAFEQRAVIEGSDGQSISLLFVNVRPGFHQIDFGPWPVEGSHPFCLRTGL
jgi:hypothetical protein